jgi:hypothetical protein
MTCVFMRYALLVAALLAGSCLHLNNDFPPPDAVLGDAGAVDVPAMGAGGTVGLPGTGGAPGEAGAPPSMQPDAPVFPSSDAPPSADAAPTGCTVGKTRCAAVGQATEICLGGDAWVAKETCTNGVCQDGLCTGSCTPPKRRCGRNETPENCGPTGDWIAETRCSYQCTGDGMCTGCAKDEDCTGGNICVANTCAAPKCGDGRKTGAEACDDGAANVAGGYGQKGKCTTDCQPTPFCGDGVKNGSEKCDDKQAGKTDLGACNPECSGFYEKRTIKLTGEAYATDLGGPSGADKVCQKEFGAAWKALLVGGSRRATQAPLKGDGQQDWVLHKYTHYFNESGQLVWRTDDVALLGVRDGKWMSIYAAAYDATSGNYAWSGWNDDWTTVTSDDSNSRGTCNGWTTGGALDGPITGWANFAKTGLTLYASEPCGRKGPLLCVEQ